MTILVLDYIFDRMQNNQNPGGSGLLPQTSARETMSIGAARRSSSSSSSNSGGRMGKRPGKKPGRKPSKIDEHAKLERSRQSARECRARKKLRYQYLEELVLNREKAVFALRDELETYEKWCADVDQGQLPLELGQKVASELSKSLSPSDLCPDEIAALADTLCSEEDLDQNSVDFDRETSDLTQKEDM